jgi:hypothetical protein
VIATELSSSLAWALAVALIVHLVGVIIPREPRFDLWLTRVSRTPRVKNQDLAMQLIAPVRDGSGRLREAGRPSSPLRGTSTITRSRPVTACSCGHPSARLLFETADTDDQSSRLRDAMLQSIGSALRALSPYRPAADRCHPRRRP